jgi:AcrR family transcriptional regulator
MVQTKPSDRSEAKRTEILRRAAEVFRRKGFHEAGMREIAASLEMAPGALYYYFESKDDLLYACQLISLKRLLASATEIAESGDPADVKVRRLVRAHLGHILDELGGSFAHIEFHALPEAKLREVVSRRDAYEALVRGVLREGVESGVFRDVEVKLTSLALLGALNWTAVWWHPAGREDLTSVSERFAEIFLRGLMA